MDELPAIARIARLRVYPFKAFDGADVPASGATLRGGLRHDRWFAFVDERRRFVNGKSDPRVHSIRINFDAAMATATFTDAVPSDGIRVNLGENLDELAQWMSSRIGRVLHVARDDDGGFPDDERAAGPTIVSTATLAAVASWFAGMDVDAVRRRLRSNIEIDGVPAFWEDRLFAALEAKQPQFQLGGITLAGVNPCARCIVPSRDADTAAALSGFAKRVAEMRAATLPAWSNRSRFDHFYRLAVNTRLIAGYPDGMIRVGDRLALVASG